MKKFNSTNEENRVNVKVIFPKNGKNTITEKNFCDFSLIAISEDNEDYLFAPQGDNWKLMINVLKGLPYIIINGIIQKLTGTEHDFIC